MGRQCGHLGTPWKHLLRGPLPWKGGLASQKTMSGPVQGKGMFTWPPLPDQVVRSRGPRRGSGPEEGHQGQGHSPQPASSLDKQASCVGCGVIHHNHKSKRQRTCGQSLNETWRSSLSWASCMQSPSHVLSTCAVCDWSRIQGFQDPTTCYLICAHTWH